MPLKALHFPCGWTNQTLLSLSIMTGVKISMDGYLSEYLPIAVFMALAIGLSIAFVVGALVVGSQKPDIEKLTAYEYGFDAFDDSRKPFDVRFYLVAILFIIFDLKSPFYSPGLSP